MEKTICAGCGQSGGRFRWRGKKGWFHVPACAPMTHGDRMRDTAKSTFPFVAQYLRTPSEGGQVEVQNMRHLRKLESEYGAVAEVYSNDQSYQGEKY